MRRNLIATAATVAVVTATAGFAVLAGSSGSTAAGTPSSAYAFAAEGALPFAGQPYVESSDGKTQTANLVELPDNPLAALGAGTVSAGDNKASVEMLNLSVGGGVFDQLPEVPEDLKKQCDALPDTGIGDLPVPELPAIPALPVPGLPDLNDLPDELPADDLRELCRLLLTPPSSLVGLDLLKVSCNGATGTVEMGALTVLGVKVPAPAMTPNTTIPGGPLFTITLNKQTKNADGSFTVKGMEISLGGGAQVITFGNATCAKFTKPTKPTPTNTPTAPSPTPVPTNLPVTG
ncbi:choice-of-anchor P family protein [Nocardioides speluncae]|uniref:choice-of-anchor P family protein n=1 Tax=Nocardioides speluncae TaxID=2670337 RepID=UPI000D698DF1|nr:choice-of-anchor P family protein [Nocardioides speluncae]